MLNDAEFEKQLLQWDGLIIRQARKYYKHTPSEIEDFVQQALLKAWMCRKSYDPSKGAFSTWLHSVIWTLMDFLNVKANSTKRIPRTKFVRLYHKDHELKPIAEKEKKSNLFDIHDCIEQLKPHERFSIEQHLMGYNFREMADKYGLTKAAYSNAHRNGVDTLRKRLAG